MVKRTDTQFSSVELSSSLEVNCGLFVASLINALFAQSVGRYVVFPYSFHFVMIGLWCFVGTLSTKFKLLGGASSLVVLQTPVPIRGGVDILR